MQARPLPNYHLLLTQTRAVVQVSCGPSSNAHPQNIVEGLGGPPGESPRNSLTFGLFERAQRGRTDLKFPLRESLELGWGQMVCYPGSGWKSEPVSIKRHQDG